MVYEIKWCKQVRLSYNNDLIFIIITKRKKTTMILIIIKAQSPCLWIEIKLILLKEISNSLVMKTYIPSS